MDNDSSRRWFRVTPLAPALDLISEPFVHPYLSANMHLLRGRDADLLVDTGMGILPLAPVLPLTPGRPLIVVATHIHLDHVGALHEFAERWGPAQSASAFGTMPAAKTYEAAFAALDAPVTQEPYPGFDVTAYAIKPAPLTRILADGDTVDLGDRQFSVLHLPGHSPDSIALLDEKDGLFFAGDAIYDDMLIDDLPDSDRADYRRTMRRILDLPVASGFGGHGPAFDGDRMRAIASEYLARDR